MPIVTGRLGVDVVCEVRRIPNHNVLAIDRLAVDPLTNVCLEGRPYRDRTVINLCPAVTHDPNIAAPKRPVWLRCSYPIICARDDVIAFAACLV